MLADAVVLSSVADGDIVSVVGSDNFSSSDRSEIMFRSCCIGIPKLGQLINLIINFYILTVN